MKPELVRFSSHPRPFRVKTVRCANLECECAEVTFHFRELMEDGESTAEAMVFQVRLDGRTWEEIVPSHRLPEVARLSAKSKTHSRDAQPLPEKGWSNGPAAFCLVGFRAASRGGSSHPAVKASRVNAISSGRYPPGHSTARYWCSHPPRPPWARGTWRFRSSG